MADDKTFTKADIDAAVAAATGAMDDKIEELSNKYAGAMDDLKKAQREVRAARDIKPEDLAAAEERADKAEAALKDANKQVGTLTKERDGAVKALETEQGAARGYALEAEIAGAIAAGNVVPALVPALKAMVMSQAKADLVDGKYAVTIGDKPAKEYLGAFLDSEDGKAFKAAAVNGGGGAGGGGGSQGGGKTMTKAEYDALDPVAKAAAGAQMVKRELKVIDAAA